MTVVLRKNFYTIYTFLVQRLECYFCRYPFYQITSFRKKGQFSDSRIRRYGGIISFICYSLYDTYLLRDAFVGLKINLFCRLVLCTNIGAIGKKHQSHNPHNPTLFHLLPFLYLGN